VKAELEVRELVAGDLFGVAALHLAAFPRSALTNLGGEAVRRYYEWLLGGPHDRSAMGAFHQGELVAFLFGGTFKGAMTGFLHRHRWYLARHVATHPWLVFTPIVRSRIGLALRLLERRRRPQAPPPASPPTYGVLAIAVSPRWQGLGAGRLLMQCAEADARARGFDRIQLTVSAWNKQAIEFYLRGGWTKVLHDGAWSGLMIKPLS